MPAAPEPFARLADILAEAAGGVRPTTVELAELLWLARQMEHQPASSAQASVQPPADRTDASAAEPVPGEAETPEEAAEPAGPAPGPPRRRKEEREGSALHDRVPLHLPVTAAASSDPTSHVSLLAPVPPMLRRPLALQRALRPVKRHTDAPVGHEFDEQATAHRIARAGGAPEWWLPVLRPARERWLSLHLVQDTGPTMPVWQPLFHELHTVLAQSGVFRTVTVHRARPDGTVSGSSGHAPATGRTVTLLVSDCMGPQWRAGEAGIRWYTTLRRWSHRMPLAVVQPLPEHLWRDTALPTTPGLLTAPFPAAPLSALTFSPYDPYPPDDADARYAAGGAVPLPVLEPDPAWLGHWAELVARRGGNRIAGSVARLTPAPARPDESGDLADATRLPAEDLVLRFRATASPEAFRLAGHLAVGRPDLPVMRLVQAAVEPAPRPQHLAEIILSGMLTTTPGPPGSYAFRPGVQELLLRGLPRSARGRVTQLLERTGALIDERVGLARGEFRASTPSASGTERMARSEPIATVSRESARRLLGGADTGFAGGRYRFVEGSGADDGLRQAEDTELGRTVSVRTLPAPRDEAARRAFLRDAAAFAGIEHPNVLAVHDYGVEDGRPYVVMERPTAITLNSLAGPDDCRLPAALLLSVGQQLAEGLRAVHRAGLAHGRLAMTRVLLLPAGTVKLMPGALGQIVDHGQEEQSADLRALGVLLFQLASGREAFAGTSIKASLFTALPPGETQRSFTSALTGLLSEDPAAQQQGRFLLSSISPVLVADRTLRYSLLGRPAISRGKTRQPSLDHPATLAMLCMLLLQHGREVTHVRLAQGIWEGLPVDAARALLEGCAARLRTALGPGVLATLPNGYALHTSTDFVDVIRCERLVSQAETRRAAGDIASARGHVNDALKLWRGVPLEGVPGPAAHAARSRLDDRRLSLLATRAELDMELGEFTQVSVDLAALVLEHPFREDFRRLQMIALQRQGRVEEALEAYEDYESAVDSTLQSPEMLFLGRELRAEYREGTGEGGSPYEYEETPNAGSPYRFLSDPDELPDNPWDDGPDDVYDEYRTAAVFYRFADGPQPAETRALLHRTVTRLLAASGLEGGEYELLTHDEGCAVRIRDWGAVLSLLRVTLNQIRYRVAELDDARLRVSFLVLPVLSPDQGTEMSRTAAAMDVLNASDADAVVAVTAPSADLLEEEFGSAAPQELRHALGSDRTDAPPTAWHRPFHRSRFIGSDLHLFPTARGPYPLPAGGARPVPEDADTAVVYGFPRNRLDRAWAPNALGYYEVDLAPHSNWLNVLGPTLNGVPVFRATGKVTWRISDPVDALWHTDSGTVDAIHSRLSSALGDITVTYPPAHMTKAQAALDAGLARHTVPGHALSWEVSLSTPAAATAPTPPSRGEPSIAAAIAGADSVLLGFNGPLARLFRPDEATEAARELARHLAGRNSGEPPLPPPESFTDPLDLLRAFAEHDLAEEVRLRLDEIELHAVRTAEPRPYADLLVRTLDTKGVGVAVVTDHATETAETYLRNRDLMSSVRGGAHGRATGPTRLMPHPHCLLMALDQLGTPASRTLLVGYSAAERQAAHALGLPFIAFARDNQAQHQHSAPNGAPLLVSGLLPLLLAAQAR
ncbi:SAV_2336 N-terminal domain-related protein [Streptomyces sp. GQFP]|uniref:SAV_2336 N-terminal domain-related protein n=1 Tax=Streptomyces sp. GQFP TaxID=2907545 RepID=UPI001F3E52B2|nr:SAV_2336 N-terminal domain-related protein [Streptomyces sp. GQFP]UIX34865.1 protein kinase [Streptomyces sp. GQFP]